VRSELAGLPARLTRIVAERQKVETEIDGILSRLTQRAAEKAEGLEAAFVTVNSGFVLPKYAHGLRMNLAGYSGELRMAQYTFETTEIRQLFRSRERRRYGRHGRCAPIPRGGGRASTTRPPEPSPATARPGKSSTVFRPCPPAKSHTGLVATDRFAAIPAAALDPPHRAVSPVVPALHGCGSTSKSLPDALDSRFWK
jgi:hypothetical protein